MKERKARKAPEPPIWTSSYNCYSFRRGFVPVTINWAMDGGGFEISVAGRRCSKKPNDLSKGKIIAMQALKEMTEVTAMRAETELNRLKEKYPDVDVEDLFKDVTWKRI